MKDACFDVSIIQVCVSRGFDGFRRCFVCCRSGVVLPCLVSASAAFKLASGYDFPFVVIQHSFNYGFKPVCSDAFYIALCGADGEIILTQFKRGFHNAV